MNNIDKTLKELNIFLEKPSSPAANYIPYSIVGNLVFISGQLPFKQGTIPITGIVGEDVNIENAIQMAELCALALVSQLKEACNGNLDKVKKVVKLGGFVASSKDFTDQPKVINGASDTIAKVFDDNGMHARAAVSTNSLPLGVAVEVDAIFELN